MMKSVFSALLILLAQSLSAQHWGEFGLVAGGSYYMGDLNPSKPFLMTRGAVGILYRYNFNQRVAVRGNFIYGGVQGDDQVSKANTDRALSFKSYIAEIGSQVEVNFFDYRLGSDLNNFSPYIFGGVSYFGFNPTRKIEGHILDLRSLRTEGQGSIIYPGRKPYDKWAWAIPFGLGAKLSISKTVGLGIEWGMRKTFTDYLDDVSKTYYLDLAGKYANINDASVAEKATDPTASHAKDMQRGNAHNNDWYSFALVSVVVKLKIKNDGNCLEKTFW